MEKPGPEKADVADSGGEITVTSSSLLLLSLLLSLSLLLCLAFTSAGADNEWAITEPKPRRFSGKFEALLLLLLLLVVLPLLFAMRAAGSVEGAKITAAVELAVVTELVTDDVDPASRLKGGGTGIVATTTGPVDAAAPPLAAVVALLEAMVVL